MRFLFIYPTLFYVAGLAWNENMHKGYTNDHLIGLVICLWCVQLFDAAVAADQWQKI